ncbi:GNAT family N-acetyltransferase [Lutispora thermophila]|uniref:Ribosomal protein S18 acetylase RimI n=1 Tax=Lutispora thermophila DSM 19022 TaxID=1122184 RepID=A0A1M6EKI0_9FIRM|nr:GNAT family N-acetyltransferase [Lutispora thermophila]SHI85939.1 Ribosomal protein S18 acetylase RimI [Lutispora thermophila DSM 19022]
MHIKSLNRLDPITEKEIEEVYWSCKEHDNLKGNLYLDGTVNFNQEMKYLFLLYEENKLVSFLFMFIPTREEAEISAYTLPDYRRRGYFKKLLSEAVEELKIYDIKDILFVCENQSLSGKESINSLGAEYDFTEYYMKFDKASKILDNSDEFKTKFYLPDKSDIRRLAYISAQVYEGNYEEEEEFIKNCLNSAERKTYATVLGDQIIGIGSGYFGHEEVAIYGVGILPEFQGKGYGKELILLIVKHLLETGHDDITIEVDSNNIKAFNLYKNTGFVIKTAFDYYRKPVKTINL